MIPLLFSVIFSEIAVIVLLLFRSPLRKLLIIGLDKMKRGKGPIVMKTVCGTIFILFATTVHSIIDVTGRGDAEPGKLNPTDQILMVRHLLDSSLMGFILFLGLMIDRLHHYIRELGLLRKTMEVSKKQQTRTFDDSGNKKKNNGSKTDDNDVVLANSMAEQITALRNQVKLLENVCEAKSDEAKSADAKAEALKKQCDGLLMEYDRLLEDNEGLKTQLREIHGNVVSNSDENKVKNM